MTADLTPAQAARLAAIEAAPWAEEAAVERVARAIHVAHLEARVVGDPPTPTIYTYRRLAVAAIDVMRGATDDGAIGDTHYPEYVEWLRAGRPAPATAKGDDRG